MVVLAKSCSKAASVVVPDEFLLMLNALTIKADSDQPLLTKLTA
jgi:hypothetical protein